MDKSEYLTIIGLKIKQIRESKGISQKKLAADCNYKKSYMSRIESGNTNPTIYTLYTISLAIEEPLSNLSVIINIYPPGTTQHMMFLTMFAISK